MGLYILKLLGDLICPWSNVSRISLGPYEIICKNHLPRQIISESRLSSAISWLKFLMKSFAGVRNLCMELPDVPLSIIHTTPRDLLIHGRPYAPKSSWVAHTYVHCHPTSHFPLVGCSWFRQRLFSWFYVWEQSDTSVKYSKHLLQMMSAHLLTWPSMPSHSCK